MLTSCASNVNGSAYPYNTETATGALLRYCCGQGLSYNPKKSTSNFLEVTGTGITGTAYSVSNEYYPWKRGGMVFLNNLVNYQPTTGNGSTINLNVGTPNNFTFIVGWEYVASNLGNGADIVAGAYASSTHDWWIGQAAPSTNAYSFSRNGSTVTLGTAPVVGRRYIAVVGNDFTNNRGYFYLFDSNGGSYSNTAIGGVAMNTAGTISLGKYGQFTDVYLPRIYVGDALYAPSYLDPTTRALPMKDQIKYRYGISV